MDAPRPLDPSTGRTALRLVLLVPLLAIALVTAACGGGDSGSSGDSNSGSGSGNSVAAAKNCPLAALDKATGPVNVTIWHAYVGLQKSTLEELAAKFNASQQKIKVTVEAQGTYEELLKKFQDALGDPATLPDLVITEDITTQFMIDTGVVVPAGACQAADKTAATTYDDVLPAVKAAYTVDDVLWPGAFSVSTPVLYTNNAILKAAGVDPTKPPTTLDELRTVAEKIKAANVPGVQEPLVLKVDSWNLEMWLTGAGKALVNQDNGRSGLATESKLVQPDTTKIFDWYKSMIDDGLLKAIPSSSTGIDEYLALNNKTSAMLIQSSAAITTVAALLEGSVKPGDLSNIGANAAINQGLDIDVSLQPGLKEAGKGQIGGSAWYMVNAKDDAAVAGAWSFLKFFLQTPNQVEWALKGSYLPVLKSAKDDPTLTQVFTTTTKGKWLSTAYQGISNLNPDFPGPVIGPYTEFRTETRKALDSVAFNGTATKTAIDDANTAFQKALDAYKADVGG
jgi:sn-glycerol 3-phosphate transport system substrate-binding protein